MDDLPQSMILPDIEKSIQVKLNEHQHELVLLLKSVLDVPGHDASTDALHNIVDIYNCALVSSPERYFNAEPAGALIINSFWIRPQQLGHVLSTFSTFPLTILSGEEIMQLQPRLFKVVADISNGYWREVYNTVHRSELTEPEKKRKPADDPIQEMFPGNQKPFIPHLIREFLEINQRLETEIKEHQRARLALLDSERRYRTLAESADDYIFVINHDDQVEYLNQYAKKLIQSDGKNPAGMQRTSFFSTNTNDAQRRVLRDVFETGSPRRGQDWTELNDGTRIFLDTRLVPLSDNGGVRAVLGIARDMTREKLNEDKIVENERKYHSLFDAIHNAIFLVNDGRIVDCNKSSTLFFDKTKDELIGYFFAELLAFDQSKASLKKTIHGYLEKCQAGGDHHFEIDYRRATEVLNFEIHLTCFSGFKSSHVLAVIRNITPYKKATETIRASEERFRDIIKRSIDGYFFIDVNYQLRHYNSSAEKILTYSREELNERLFSKLHEEWNKKLHKVLKRAMGGTTFEWEEFSFQDRYNVNRWVAINVRRVYENGHVSGVEGFIKDITHRKKAEIELIENEARYRALFESTPYDVFGLTIDRHFLKVNQNFQLNWGRVENKAVHNFRPKALSTLIMDLCDDVDKTKQSQEKTFSCGAKNSVRHYRVIVAPIITEREELLGFAGLIIETTDAVTVLSEKKAFAERLIQTSEEEQRRISRDIHDSLGQILFALQLEISSAKALLKKDVQMAERVLFSSEEKLSSAMNEASAICYRLSPQLLADFGLVVALEDLLHTIRLMGHIDVKFEKRWLKRKKSKSLETALFRVSQEALGNIMKHSHATQVQIKLKETKEQISLSISDNGDGFDFDGVTQRRKRGFGLINMKERIEMLGGEFSIQSAPQAGTQIDIMIPFRTKETYG